MEKTTNELRPGDVVVVNGRYPRTVAAIRDSGWLNFRDETIWTVSYVEGATAEWSGANTASGGCRWQLEALDLVHTKAMLEYHREHYNVEEPVGP